ncbi:DNA mismatch repair protein [Microbacterium lacticum]|uniref:DNA mismatch repair protein n=1 Tax=Microbacterium lacticum TaxID=33885 RepID=UPI003A8C382C
MILTTQNGPAVGVRGVTLRAVSDRRWRVLDRTGRVIGHLRAEAQSTGIRFHAERFDLASARLRHLGAFWSADEAIDCLRYLR